jgi:predicted protein tyrosine phosphatase
VIDGTPARFRITVCGLDELSALGAGNVTHVVSILDPGWPDPPELQAFAAGRHLTLRFHDVIDASPESIAPESGDIERLLAFGRDLANDRAQHLLVHCHAGVSRSTAAAILLLAQRYADRPADEAVLEIARLRPRAWPNLRILELGDAALGRGGAIVEAARAHYRHLYSYDDLQRGDPPGSGDQEE